MYDRWIQSVLVCKMRQANRPIMWANYIFAILAVLLAAVTAVLTFLLSESWTLRFSITALTVAMLYQQTSILVLLFTSARRFTQIGDRLGKALCETTLPLYAQPWLLRLRESDLPFQPFWVFSDCNFLDNSKYTAVDSE